MKYFIISCSKEVLHIKIIQFYIVGEMFYITSAGKMDKKDECQHQRI